MFKKGSYNVKKAEAKSKIASTVKPKTANTSNTSNTQTSTTTLKKKKKENEASQMTLSKKTNITNVNNKESPEYRKKSHPKTVTTNKKWVENKTFKPK